MSPNVMIWEVCELSNLEALGSGFEEPRSEICKIRKEKQPSKQKPEHSHSGQSVQPESVTASAGDTLIWPESHEGKLPSQGHTLFLGQVCSR